MTTTHAWSADADSTQARQPSGTTIASLLADGVVPGTVAAGHDGLDRVVERVNVMEVPDILDFVKPHELLVTTAYPLRGRGDDLDTLVQDLDDAGLAGLGVKLGRYLDELPDSLLEAAEQRAFPVIVLDPATRFDEVLNDVLSQVLSDQTARLRRSERIHRTFLQLVVDGGGVEAITAELSALVDAPSAIVSLDGDVLAHHRLDEVLPDSDDITQVDLSPDTGHLRISADHVVVELAPAAAGPRLFGHVITVPHADRRPGAAVDGVGNDHRMALESAATVTALALSMASEIMAVEAKYQSDLMHDLLTGRITSPADALRRARAFGWDLDRPLITLVLQTDDAGDTTAPIGSPRSPLPTALAGLLRQRDPRATVVRFSEEVVVLTMPFGGDEARDRARDWLAEQITQAQVGTGLVVSGGLSRPVDDLTEIPRGYDQAVSALAVGRKVHGPGHLTHFDDLGAHRVLSLIDEVDELRSFATEVLGELASDDDTTSDLRRTLQVLLDTNLNVAESARRMHFHYNTLRYRIDKLQTMVGPFMDDADIRLNVQLALLIHDMRGIA